VCDGFPWTVNDYLTGCPNQCIDADGTDTQTFAAAGSFSGTFEVSGNQTFVTWNIDDIDGTPVSSTNIFWDPNNVEAIGAGNPPTTCDGDFQCGTEYGGMGYCMTIGIYFTGSLCVTCSADGLTYPGGTGYSTSCGISTNITYGNHTNSYSSSGDSSIDNEWQEATYPYCDEPIDPLIQCDCDNRESCLLAYSSDSTATWNISFSATPTTCP
jgi:hypothetical protein